MWGLKRLNPITHSAQRYMRITGPGCCKPAHDLACDEAETPPLAGGGLTPSTAKNLTASARGSLHTHNDHREGRDAFKDATLIASQRCLDNMPQRIRLGKWSKEAFTETFTLTTDEGSVEFYHTGGHSVGHSIAYVPSEKILFGCDLFIVKRVNFGLPFMSFYQNNPKRTGNPEEYLAAYRKFLAMDLEVIVPGHGDLVYDPQPYLKEQIAFFEALKSFIISAVQEGRSLEEIELPRLGLIEQAYITAESRLQRSRNLRFLENYLQHLKTSFFDYYSST